MRKNGIMKLLHEERDGLMSQHPLNQKWQTYWKKIRLNCVCGAMHGDDVLFLESLQLQHVFSTDPTQRELTFEVHLLSTFGKGMFTQGKFNCHFYSPGTFSPSAFVIELLQTFFDEVEIYLYFDLASYERSVYGY